MYLLALSLEDAIPFKPISRTKGREKRLWTKSDVMKTQKRIWSRKDNGSIALEREKVERQTGKDDKTKGISMPTK